MLFLLQKNIKRATINPGNDEKPTIEFEILGIEEIKDLYEEYWTLESSAPEVVELSFLKVPVLFWIPIQKISWKNSNVCCASFFSCRNI